MDRKQVVTVQCRNCNELQEVKMVNLCSKKLIILSCTLPGPGIKDMNVYQYVYIWYRWVIGVLSVQ